MRFLRYVQAYNHSITTGAVRTLLNLVSTSSILVHLQTQNPACTKTQRITTMRRNMKWRGTRPNPELGAKGNYFASNLSLNKIVRSH